MVRPLGAAASGHDLDLGNATFEDVDPVLLGGVVAGRAWKRKHSDFIRSAFRRAFRYPCCDRRSRTRTATPTSTPQLGSSSEHALELISEIVREASCPV
ncbi:MAG: hypothetical protein ACXVRS_14095, partial [Gaiellaceae bacterium]